MQVVRLGPARVPMAAMSATSSATDDARQTVKRAANSKWADGLARLGFCARGLVYAIVGLIALQIASKGTASD